ncbi:kinesin-like protein KIN-14C [Zingiber officinale]|uniref:kinesin-like protein KIN-14C n=1 Tax=Zingiber officinale TaxID=94328 RepID=UPI001C4AAD73|nr:kinesin-like protein KIN-14C [Zingiber officinale]
MGGHKFHEVFQLRPGNYYDLPAAKITEMMKSNSLDNAPTQSLLSVVNGILDESIERRNGEIPHRVSCLLRKVVQEIERRISTQADHIRNQNNLIKAREEKYQSRIRVLETLANGTICEIQTEKQKMEERNNKYGEEDMTAKLTKQKEKNEQSISELKRELEITKKSYEQLLQKMEMNKASSKYYVESDKEKNEQIISQLKKELETMKRSYEQQQQMETTKAAGEHRVELDKEKNEQTISQLQKELEIVKRSYERQLEQMETTKVAGEHHVEQDKENNKQSIAQLQKELETVKRSYEQQLKQIEITKAAGQKQMELHKEKDEQTISQLQKELETVKRSYERQLQQMETTKAAGEHHVEQDKENNKQSIAQLQKELETVKRSYEQQLKQIEITKAGQKQMELHKEKDEQTISQLQKELETVKRSYERQLQQMETTKAAGEHHVELDKENNEQRILQLQKELETVKRSYEQQLEQIEITKAGQKQMELHKEKDEQTISQLKKELETTKKSFEHQLQQIEINKATGQKHVELDKEKNEQTISQLKKELEIMKRSYEQQLEQIEIAKAARQTQMELHKEKDEQTISQLKKELETTKKSFEHQLQQIEISRATGQRHVELDKEKNEQTISQLKKELETMKRSYQQQLEQMEIAKATEQKHAELDMARLVEEKEKSEHTISEIRQELETVKKSHERELHQMENQAREHDAELEQKIKNAESSLAKSERRFLELKKNSETKFQIWNRKEQAYQSYIDIQFQLVKELRSSSHSIKHEVVITQKGSRDEIISFGRQLKVLTDAVENYHSVVAENRKLYNEVQELKGNIRVYCRIRPFLPGENHKHTIIDHIGDDGEVAVSNPSKSGKDGQKMFKFNKAYGQTATQEQVYLDTQPLVRSVLDGFNVCIFAYGQTGSGKTYTMTGPDIATEKEWGVNYRALNDLFQISLKRKDTYMYEVGVQMVEIYNEQIRDLLATGGSQKKLGVLTTSHPTGLAVPDACMLPVKSTSDVMDVMQTGHSNRAVSSTSLNERSSRSHSVVTIHVRGTDLKTGATSRGSLHLVDLAGSERVDRSEVTGDRLKEAQHINKSLAALGDVVFALSQKSAHVPYRNSKLTQVLQSSLGGHAKTLMFIQINPEIASFTESLSTLKFAERVSGVELGAAKSQKEGKDIRDLMEQVASLKDTIARKDEEIEQLQQIKGSVSKHGNVSPLRHSSSPRISVLDGEDPDQKENLDGEAADQNSAELELLGYDDGDSEERLSDISETDQTDGSVGSSDNPLLEQVKSSETTKEKISVKCKEIYKSNNFVFTQAFKASNFMELVEGTTFSPHFAAVFPVDVRGKWMKAASDISMETVMDKLWYSLFSGVASP